MIIMTVNGDTNTRQTDTQSEAAQLRVDIHDDAKVVRIHSKRRLRGRWRQTTIVRYYHWWIALMVAAC